MPALLASCPGASFVRFFPQKPFFQHFPWADDTLHNLDMLVSPYGRARSMACIGMVPIGELVAVPGDNGELGADALHCCRRCAKLPYLAEVSRAASRSMLRGSLSLQRKYWTIGQRDEALAARTAVADLCRLQVVAGARTTSVARRRVEFYECIMDAVATSNVPRIDALIRVALRNGRGPNFIAKQIARAAKGAYAAKSFSSAERDIMLLVLRLGHRGLAYAVAHALGLPSITTTLDAARSADAQIRVTHCRVFEAGDVAHNVKRAVSLFAEQEARARRQGLYGVLCDATCVSRNGGYDPFSGSLTGVCRCFGGDTTDTTYGNVAAVAAGVRSGVYHLCQNVDLYAIVDLLGVSRPLHIVFAQGTCGDSGTDVYAKNELVASAWRTHAQALGPLIVAGHDGASALRRASELGIAAAAAEEAAGTAPLAHPSVKRVRELLQVLRAFDCRLQRDGKRGCADLKHVLKRCLIDQATHGLTIGNIYIRVAELQRIVAAALGLSRSSATVLRIFALQDKMRVSTAMRYLGALATYALPLAGVAAGTSSSSAASSSPTPSASGAAATAFRELEDDGCALFGAGTPHRAALILLARFADLTTAWVDRLPILEQLTRISTLAHLIVVLQLATPRTPRGFGSGRSGDARFCTSEVCYDFLTACFSAFHLTAHCIARAESTHEPVPVHLFLLGSDKLEEFFATMRRVRSTFNMEQVQATLQSALDASTVIQRHSDWRRRDVRRDLADTKAGTRSDDHQGISDVDVKLTSVGPDDAHLLGQSWDAGRKRAMALCTEARAGGLVLSRNDVDVVKHVFEVVGYGNNLTLMRPLDEKRPIGVAAV